MAIDKMRRSYISGGLDVADAAANPVDQFTLWFDDSVSHSPGDWFEANAMNLATSDGRGHVTSRIVLLKGFDDGCPMFFTNYESEKGRQLAMDARAAVCFYWPHRERQVRIEGAVEMVSDEISDRYFHSRPRGSQLGAAASPQSQVVPDRQFLQQRLDSLEAQYGTGEIPRPANWGGYRLRPRKFEFWQGRENRLHDRIVYAVTATGRWDRCRVSP
jgi:pyridoxamine 5'-phosphate oxidase